MKDKITVSWGKTSAYNLPPAILIGHLLSQKMFISKTASKIQGKIKVFSVQKCHLKPRPHFIPLQRRSPATPPRHHGTQTRAAAASESASRKPNHAGNQRTETCQAPRLAAPRRSPAVPARRRRRRRGTRPSLPVEWAETCARESPVPAPGAAAGEAKRDPARLSQFVSLQHPRRRHSPSPACPLASCRIRARF